MSALRRPPSAQSMPASGPLAAGDAAALPRFASSALAQVAAAAGRPVTRRIGPLGPSYTQQIQQDDSCFRAVCEDRSRRSGTEPLWKRTDRAYAWSVPTEALTKPRTTPAASRPPHEAK